MKIQKATYEGGLLDGDGALSFSIENGLVKGTLQTRRGTTNLAGTMKLGALSMVGKIKDPEGTGDMRITVTSKRAVDDAVPNAPAQLSGGLDLVYTSPPELKGKQVVTSRWMAKRTSLKADNGSGLDVAPPKNGGNGNGNGTNGAVDVAPPSNGNGLEKPVSGKPKKRPFPMVPAVALGAAALLGGALVWLGGKK